MHEGTSVCPAVLSSKASDLSELQFPCNSDPTHSTNGKLQGEMKGKVLERRKNWAPNGN